MRRRVDVSRINAAFDVSQPFLGELFLLNLLIVICVIFLPLNSSFFNIFGDLTYLFLSSFV